MNKIAIVAAAASAGLSVLALLGDAQAGSGKTSCGAASWYALTSRTASGEMMNPAAMTAAHRTLPLGTVVTVTNLSNNKSVVVRINDRGPYAKGRLIDLSKGAARKLGFIGAGHTRVRIGSNAGSCA